MTGVYVRVASELARAFTEVQAVRLARATAFRSAVDAALVFMAEAELVAHGGRLPAAGPGAVSIQTTPSGPVAAFGPDGALIALLTEEGGQARSLAVFAG